MTDGGLHIQNFSTETTPPVTVGRPYRSHKVPACARCRSRKARCTIDFPGQPCLLCRLQNGICERAEKGQGRTKSPEGPKPKRPRAYQTLNSVLNSPSSRQSRGKKTHSITGISAVATASTGGDAPDKGSTMIVGPTAAEDVQAIEQYVSSKTSEDIGRSSGPYNIISNDTSKPVLYLSVPRYRKGLKGNISPGKSQRQIMEQILGPFAPTLISTYFAKIHPWFPILEERLFSHSNHNISSSLMCEIYAASLIYWSSSDVLKAHPRPDIYYAWNLAVASLQEEFLAPSIETVEAALIELNGRPIESITGNVINSGRTVALAHILGLNRDPSTWRISDEEKCRRIRLWWGVLIHDQWASFAHGVPPNIKKGNYDVPLCTTCMLVGPQPKSQTRIHGAESFIALCALTEILGDVLPLIYDLNMTSSKDSSKTIRRLRTNLDEWEENLPEWLTVGEANGSGPPPGSSSLRLGLLAAKMLLCQLSLRISIAPSNAESPEVGAYHQAELRRAAQSVVSFLCSLHSSHLQEFWLPYGAYHIASAAIILLRCAIDTKDEDSGNACMSSLERLIDRIQEVRASDDWDLADIFLTQCGDFIIAMVKARRNEREESDNVTASESQTGFVIGDLPENILGNLDFPSFQETYGLTGGLQYPFSNLWDMLEPSNNLF